MIGTIVMGIVAMFILYKYQKISLKLKIKESENYSLKLVMAEEGLITGICIKMN